MAFARLAPLLFLLVAPGVAAADESAPRESLLFHASFDRSPNAEFAKGDAHIYTAPNLKRESARRGLHGPGAIWSKTEGKTGGALRFTKKQEQLVFFRGGANVPKVKQGFQGSVSLWMRLTPTKDLPKGYVDPLQITNKKWNDASFFLDFDQAETRDFRLGVFSDFRFWNPDNRNFDDIPAKERPMVFVKQPPFRRDRWTHVAFVWRQFNQDDPGRATLFLDGKPIGTLNRKQHFSWTAEDVVIMVGINYVGWIDELMIFDRPLSNQEILGLAGQKTDVPKRE